MKQFPRRLCPPPAGVLLATLLLVTLLLAAASPSAFAQETAPNEAAAGDITRDEVNAVARTLWCPLCSGVRLDACELAACEQMRDEIATALAKGEDVETIRTSFVDSYGPQVLGAPPRSGFNLLAWALPFIALAAGGLFLILRSRDMAKQRRDVPVDHPAVSEPGDAYAQRLESELRELDK